MTSHYAPVLAEGFGLRPSPLGALGPRVGAAGLGRPAIHPPHALPTSLPGAECTSDRIKRTWSSVMMALRATVGRGQVPPPGSSQQVTRPAANGRSSRGPAPCGPRLGRRFPRGRPTVGTSDPDSWRRPLSSVQSQSMRYICVGRLGGGQERKTIHC